MSRILTKKFKSIWLAIKKVLPETKFHSEFIRQINPEEEFQKAFSL